MEFRAKFISIQGMPLDIPEIYYGTDCLTKLMIIKELSIVDVPKINNYVPPEHREHVICVDPSYANKIPAFKPMSTVLITVPESSLNLIAELKLVNDEHELFRLDRSPHFEWKVDDDLLLLIWRDAGYDTVIDPDSFIGYGNSLQKD